MLLSEFNQYLWDTNEFNASMSANEKLFAIFELVKRFENIAITQVDEEILNLNIKVVKFQIKA